MPRERLPTRRQAETVDLHYGGRRYHLTIGEYPDGRPGEVFLHGAKPGSDVDLLCDDIGVLVSRLLQYGDDPAALAAGIGRLGNGDPASLVGLIADVLEVKAAAPPPLSDKNTSLASKPAQRSGRADTAPGAGRGATARMVKASYSTRWRRPVRRSRPCERRIGPT